MRDQTGRALEKLSIFLAKSVHFVALGIEHSDDVLVTVRHRNDDLRPRGVKGRQITHILVHISHNDRFARFQSRPAQVPA